MNKKQIKELQKTVKNLESEIIKISEIGKIFNESRLKENIIALIIHKMSKVNITDVKYVLRNLENIKDYCLYQEE